VNPKSEIVAGPAQGVETILYAEAHMAETLYAKLAFNVLTSNSCTVMEILLSP
jgi:hypothetical protein